MGKIVQPKQFLQEQIGQQVNVVFKTGRKCSGILVSFDEYFNLRLKDTLEGVKFLGNVLIRCNCVLAVGVSE